MTLLLCRNTGGGGLGFYTAFIALSEQRPVHVDRVSSAFHGSFCPSPPPIIPVTSNTAVVVLWGRTHCQETIRPPQDVFLTAVSSLYTDSAHHWLHDMWFLKVEGLRDDQVFIWDLLGVMDGFSPVPFLCSNPVIYESYLWEINLVNSAWMEGHGQHVLASQYSVATLNRGRTHRTPRFLEDESGECFSGILWAGGHMESCKVGFPACSHPHPWLHSLLGTHLNVEEALNWTQIDPLKRKLKKWSLACDFFSFFQENSLLVLWHVVVIPGTAFWQTGAFEWLKLDQMSRRFVYSWHDVQFKCLHGSPMFPNLLCANSSVLRGKCSEEVRISGSVVASFPLSQQCLCSLIGSGVCACVCA